MLVKSGEIATLRDGRKVFVTDAADQDPDAYRLYDKDHYENTGEFKINAEMPVETIFVGVLWDDRPYGWSKDSTVVVSDMSEVVSTFSFVE